jgi:transcriptional regulator GlxA family with amidase domain
MLAFPDCQMLDVTGPLQMFAGVNDELGRQAYELVIAAPKRGPFKTSSGISLVADLAIADVSPAKCRASDTLIAAGGDPGLCRALESGEITALLKAARRRGARIVSVCTGTFFLAAAGLLDGRRAATHWRFVERLDFDRKSMLILRRSTCVTAMFGHRQASQLASILRLR